MKAFIFEPLWNELATPELENRLKQAEIDYEIVREIAPLREHTALYEGDEGRFLCLNPDCVDWKITVDDYKDIPNLRVIFLPVTSFSWIDMSYATERHIPVCNIKGYAAEAVAEWAIMTMLNLARQTPKLIKDGFPLNFADDYLKYRGVELHGKTAGIIGLGRIGEAIARKAKGLGMEVVYWSKQSRNDEYTYMELADVMKTADVVFPVMAINDETKQSISDELLLSMKPTAILVEMAHGLFSRDVALSMVKDGKLLGYGFESKPNDFGSYEGNVWAAPEYAWATDRSMQQSLSMQIDNIVAGTKGNFPDKVN